MKKLFTNDKFFLTTVILAVVGFLLFAGGLFGKAVMLNETSNITNGLSYAICAVCVTVIYITYRKHNKNVMKAMMGALLMAIALHAFSYLSSVRELDVFLSPIYIILAAALFINHMIINGTHRPSRANITVNIIIVLLLTVFQIFWGIGMIVESGDIFMVIFGIIYMISYPCMVASIVCVESRLDAYRLDREAAGWTEEKGYPKDYVHEYEKNKKSLELRDES